MPFTPMSGNGLLADPYIIETPEHFDSIRNNLGSSGTPTYYKLNNDLDLSSVSPFTAIGDLFETQGPAYIVLDGNNKTISNLTITGSQVSNSLSQNHYVGIFGYAEHTAESQKSEYFIKDLTVESCSVIINSDNIPVTDGGPLSLGVGILVGQMYDFTTPEQDNYNTFTEANTLRNVHIKNCTINIESTASLHSWSRLEIGGIGAQLWTSAVISCSVNSLNINTNVTGSTAFEFSPGGGISPIASWPEVIKYTNAKNCNFFIRLTDINGGPITGVEANGFTYSATVFESHDNYSLDNYIDANIPTAGYDMYIDLYDDYVNSEPLEAYTRLYCFNRFNSASMDSYLYPFSSDYAPDTSATSSYNYYTTGSYTYSNDQSFIDGLTYLSESQMKNSASYETWDFVNVWGIG